MKERREGGRSVAKRKVKGEDDYERLTRLTSLEIKVKCWLYQLMKKPKCEGKPSRPSQQSRYSLYSLQQSTLNVAVCIPDLLYVCSVSCPVCVHIPGFSKLFTVEVGARAESHTYQASANYLQLREEFYTYQASANYLQLREEFYTYQASANYLQLREEFYTYQANNKN